MPGRQAHCRSSAHSYGPEFEQGGIARRQMPKKSSRRGRKTERAAHLFFHQDSKTIVADHQQLRSAMGAEAISSTHAYLIVRQSSWCLPYGIRCNRPRCWQGSIVTSEAAPNCNGFAGSISSCF